MVAVLTAVVLAWHRWGTRSTAALAALLMAGSSAVLVGQTVVFGENASSRPWYFPSDVSALESRFADRQGLVLQFAHLKPLQSKAGPARLRAEWQHYLAGSMYHVADVEAVNNYTGMGLQRFTRRLCMAYDGLSRPCGYRQVWEPAESDGPPLVDLMKVETLVVQPELTAGVTPDPGWQSEETPGGPVVLRRTSPDPWPDSRLSAVPDGAEVTAATTVDGTSERVELSSTGSGGEVVFATLGWPGYRATFDGESVPAVRGPAGLLTVRVPADAAGDLVVSYQPPGFRAGLLLAAVGTLGALALGVASAVASRRRRSR
jgi:hypothetical protein